MHTFDWATDVHVETHKALQAKTGSTGVAVGPAPAFLK
jgi:hypothetical protein